MRVVMMMIMDNLRLCVCGRWIMKSIHLTVKKEYGLSSCLSGVGDVDFNVDKFYVLGWK
jgi:hypothetical protein